MAAVSGWDSLLALTLSVVAVVGYAVQRWVPARTRGTSHTVNEQVDDDVLGRFNELHNRITALELELREQRLDTKTVTLELKSAQGKILELERLEEHLNARLHEKDRQMEMKEAEIERLRRRLDSYRRRLRALENFVREQYGEIPAGIEDVDTFGDSDGGE